MDHNITVSTDSYKFVHRSMYPPGTEYVYSYFESRKGALFNATQWFGLQYILKEYFLGDDVLTPEKIQYGQFVVDQHMYPGAFPFDPWMDIYKRHGGKLPLEIKSVPEGMSIPTNNVLMSVQNTDKKHFWITNYFESILTHVWAPSTVSTLSREVLLMCKTYLEQTADSLMALPYMFHDFGYRGAPSEEAAMVNGMGHTVNSRGTDTAIALLGSMMYYNAPGPTANSVDATEHSIMTAEGPDGEFNVFKRLVNLCHEGKDFPEGPQALVIDSYNYKRFILEYARELKDVILARKDTATAPGKTVFRPDSGDPVAVTLDVLEMLDEVFGSTINGKGYKVLNPKVGMLWGDGIDYMGVRDILHAMKSAGWSAENIIFGMGGGLHAKVNRDTQRFAFKSSAQCRNGKWYDVWKEPLDMTKASKRGIQYLYQHSGSHGTGYFTTNVKDPSRENILNTTFLNGALETEYSWQQVQDNAGFLKSA